METRSALGSLSANIGKILMVSLLLAASVGIGSALTQHLQSPPVDYNFVAQLVLIFWLITAFGGIVYAMAFK